MSKMQQQPLFPCELTPTRISWIRETLGLTHTEMAMRCHVCETAVYRWESNKPMYNRRPGRRSQAVLHELEAEAIRRLREQAALEEGAQKFLDEHPIGTIPPEALELYKRLQDLLRGKNYRAAASPGGATVNSQG